MTEKHQVLDQAILDSEAYSLGREAGLKRAIEIADKEIEWAVKYRAYYVNQAASCIKNEILKELET